MKSYARYIGAVIVNIMLVYVSYFVARLAYLFENWSYFQAGLADGGVWRIFLGGMYLDTPAICYTNALWLLMVLLPLHVKESDAYYRVCRWLFVVVNSLMFVVQLCDAVYFRFTLRRTTLTVFHEFDGEGNLMQIFGIEMLRHWYFVILAVAMAVMLWRGYLEPRVRSQESGAKSQESGVRSQEPRVKSQEPGVRTQETLLAYYVSRVCILLFFVYFTVVGMRGGFTRDIRPVNVNRAGQFITRPTDVALVLNTPFTMLKSIGEQAFAAPHYFSDEQQAETVFSPLKVAENQVAGRERKNVVFVIIESFGREYIGGFNRDILGDDYQGYTPFVDSLMEHSLTYRYSFCNGRKSIDAMPAILSSLPMFVEPYVLTPHATNHIRGIAGYLGDMGYYSAFFHGAWQGSMGFQAFARSTEWNDYFSQEDYEADARFGGHADYDGWWAIFDEPFMQYFATKMSEFREPFVTGLFTATSHHPFRVPEQYADSFADGTLPIHKTIRYVDHALRRFFATARRQPWFDNTIFIITSDHTNMSDHEQYMSDIGGFCSPIIIYDPSGTISPGRSDAIAQHIDLMPTLLNYLGYDKPYISFGCDLFSTAVEQTYAVNYLNGIYQYAKNGLLIQFDGQRTTALFRLSDYAMEHNLLSDESYNADVTSMENELKAIIQTYMYRMVNNKLAP